MNIGERISLKFLNVKFELYSYLVNVLFRMRDWTATTIPRLIKKLESIVEAEMSLNQIQ